MKHTYDPVDTDAMMEEPVTAADTKNGTVLLPVKQVRFFNCCGALVVSWLILVGIFKLETRQRVLRKGDGPYPSTIHELYLKWAGYEWDFPMSQQKDPSEKIETDKHLCFVHIGKTAGSTLSCYLGFLNPRCDESPRIPKAQGLLPASTTHMTHVGWNGCTPDRGHFDYYLFVVRDPLKRIQSWFTYEHPMNGLYDDPDQNYTQAKELYIDCNFDTLNELGEVGLAPIDESFPDNDMHRLCQARARQAIKGEVAYIKHNKYNFGFYVNELKQREEPYNASYSKVAVIRTEYLYEDWKSIEEGLLHGPKGLNVTFKYRNSSPKRPEDNFLSELARERICHYLCEDIQVYKQLLEHTVNLNDDDVAVSMQELYASCPKEAATTFCE